MKNIINAIYSRIKGTKVAELERCLSECGEARRKDREGHRENTQKLEAGIRKRNEQIKNLQSNIKTLISKNASTEVELDKSKTKIKELSVGMTRKNRKIAELEEIINKQNERISDLEEIEYLWNDL